MQATYRLRMEADIAIHAQAVASGAAPYHRPAPSGERFALRGIHRLAVATTTEGLPAILNGAGLFLSLGQGRHAAADQSHIGRGSA